MAFITVSGETQIAAKQGAAQILDITHFVLANIAGLGAEPVNRIEAMPAGGNIMATLPVTSSGYVNGNQVVYSLVMDSSLGDYDFNWVGLKDADGVLIACTYTPLIQKRKTTGAIPGNNLTRNFLIAFSGITATTAIDVPAATWQIDFNARLWGIDERERLSNYDIYGHEGFFGDGWKAIRDGATTTYNVQPGVGYVGGVRIASAIVQPVTVAGPPKSIWVDASLQGDISDVSAAVDFVIDAVAHADYTDANGFKHYVTKIASIAADGSVTDFRTSADADPHPQYATKVGVQSQSYTSFTAGGTVDALTGTIPSTLTALADKMQFTGIATGKNLTTAPTLNLTLGSTATGIKTIVKGANQALVDGDIPGAGYPCQFEWNFDFNAWVLMNPATGINISKQLHFVKLTSSGNFTTPANITTDTVFEITVVGGGAGGGGSDGSNACGGGGGAGGAVKFLISGLSPSTAYPVVIGGGGAGGSLSGGNGGNGGTTQITINSTVYAADGGIAGAGSTSASVNINSTQGAISASIIALPHNLIFQNSAGIGFAATPLFAGCNGAGLPFGTAGIAGRTGGSAIDAIGHGVGGGGGSGVAMAGGFGMPGLFKAMWVA